MDAETTRTLAGLGSAPAQGQEAGTVPEFGAYQLAFRHTGISREVVAEGWDHFLASLNQATKGSFQNRPAAMMPAPCPEVAVALLARRPGLEGRLGRRI
jgi:hypothetical protein